MRMAMAFLQFRFRGGGAYRRRALLPGASRASQQSARPIGRKVTSEEEPVMPIDLRPRRAGAGAAAVPDVSVVVPTHGRPDAIVRLLEGLARQTLPASRFEVL